MHAHRRATKRFMDTIDVWSDVDTTPSLVNIWETAPITIVSKEANNPPGRTDPSINETRQSQIHWTMIPQIGYMDPNLFSFWWPLS